MDGRRPCGRKAHGDRTRPTGQLVRTPGMPGAPARFHRVMEDNEMTFSPPTRAHHPADAYREAWRLLEDKSPQPAIEILDRAIEQEPTAMSLRTLRAWAYFQSAQLARAEAELRLLVEECPADVWARFALGRVLE